MRDELGGVRGLSFLGAIYVPEQFRSKPSKSSVAVAKVQEKEKKKGEKKNIKNIEMPKDVRHFDFCACPSKYVIKREKACCHVANVFE